jgi:hypothetical protein
MASDWDGPEAFHPDNERNPEGLRSGLAKLFANYLRNVQPLTCWI